MANSWSIALKEWNAGKSTYCMPRRGTSDYRAIKAIQSRIDRERRVPAPNPARLTAVRERARQTAERARAYNPYPDPLAPEPIVEAPALVVAPTARLQAVRSRARETAERARAYNPYPDPLAPEPIVEAPAPVVAPPVAVAPVVAKKQKPPPKKSAPKLEEELEYFRLIEEYHELKDDRGRDGKLKWKGLTEFVRPYLEEGLTHDELSIHNFGKGQGFVISGNCKSCNYYNEAGVGKHSKLTRGDIGAPPPKKTIVNGKYNNRSPREVKKALQAHYKRKVHLEGLEFAKTNPPQEDEEDIRMREEMRKYIEDNRGRSKAGAEESKAGAELDRNGRPTRKNYRTPPVGWKLVIPGEFYFFNKSINDTPSLQADLEYVRGVEEEAVKNKGEQLRGMTDIVKPYLEKGLKLGNLYVEAIVWVKGNLPPRYNGFNVGGFCEFCNEVSKLKDNPFGKERGYSDGILESYKYEGEVLTLLEASDIKKSLQNHYKTKTHKRNRAYIEGSKAGAEESKAEAEESDSDSEEERKEPAPLTEQQKELLKIAIYTEKFVIPSGGKRSRNIDYLNEVGAKDVPKSVIEQYKKKLKEGIKSGEWANDFIRWGLDDDFRIKKGLIKPQDYEDWTEFVYNYTRKVKEQKGNGMVQLGSRLYEPTYRPSQQQLDMARKEMIGKGYMVGGGQHDEENWEDYNVNIIGEAEKAGVPVPTELSVVNSVYDLFAPKLPQVNRQTGALRPAPSLFSFLNFNI